MNCSSCSIVHLHESIPKMISTVSWLRAVFTIRCRTSFLLTSLLLTDHQQSEASPLFQDALPGLPGPQPCAQTNEGCYSNYVLMADLDLNGRLDLVFANGGGYYESGSAEPLVVYLNMGEADFRQVTGPDIGDFQGRLRQVAAGDVDDDGMLELYCPDAWGLQPDAFFFFDAATGAFVDEGPERLPLSSHAAAARFGDVDADGDLDLLLSDWGAHPPRSPGTAHLYLNDGTGHFTERLQAIPQDTNAEGTGPIDMDLFDSDGDFDLDLLLASREGNSLLFINDGTGQFLWAQSQLPPQPGPYVYGPDVCDVDGDGDLDLWLDNGSLSLKEQLLINNGHGFFSDETSSRVPSSDNLKEDDNEVQCVDVDDDGDFDALITSLSAQERLLINDGTGTFHLMTDAFPSRIDASLGLDLGDLEGDGRLDAVTAQGESGAFLNRLYSALESQPIDAHPPTFRAIETQLEGVAPGLTSLRFAVTDRATSDIGPRLLEAHVTLSDGTQLPARFMGGDLFRAERLLEADQTLQWKPCATDLYGQTACGPWISLTVHSDLTPQPEVTPTPAVPTPTPAVPTPTGPSERTPLESPAPPSPTSPQTPPASSPPDVGDDADGCACQLKAFESTSGSVQLIWAFLVGYAMRRKRSSE